MSTYELIANQDEARRIPADGEGLVDLLRRRHAKLMAARPERRPGELKQVTNRVGSYVFVEPELVHGTLVRGFGLRDELPSAFGRAVYMMFLVSEVHPFDDGNGRLARLAMNAELSAAKQQRILIPLVVRNDYLAGLRRLSRDDDAELLCRVLGRAWHWSAQLDFSSLASARVMLEATNALVDPADAEREGQHLLLPHDLLT
ncbi:MAG: Fic family protein [Natronosporangium sp.]